MKKCENCIHYELCSEYYYVGDLCGGFKDNSKFVELPCSLGDTAYIIRLGDFWTDYKPYIVEAPVDRFEYYRPGIWCVFIDGIFFPFDGLGKTWFLDRAAAEEKLEKIIYGN